MKANELRIGNIVYNKENNIVYVNTNHLTVLAYGVEDVFKPIPLTEEWLLRFGGRPLKNGYWIPLYNLKAEFHFELFNNTDEIVTTLKSQFSNLILDRIKYVHQLQNLYFALTGEELTL